MEQQKKIIWKEVSPGIELNEQDWLTNRIRKITASEVWKLMGNSRDKDKLFSQTAYTYILQNIAEILTGEPRELKEIKAIEWGRRNERFAAETLQEFIQFDYYGDTRRIFYPYNNYSGASPDGVNEHSIIEIKCPFAKEHHVENLMGSLYKNTYEFMYKCRYDYLMQMYFCMICTGRKHGYFVSFDPRQIKKELKLAIIEVEPNEEIMGELLFRVEQAAEIIRMNLGMLSKIKLKSD